MCARQRSHGSYKPSGFFTVQHARVEKQHTMLDYIIGGCEISLHVAIDVRAPLSLYPCVRVAVCVCACTGVFRCVCVCVL